MHNVGDDQEEPPGVPDSIARYRLLLLVCLLSGPVILAGRPLTAAPPNPQSEPDDSETELRGSIAEMLEQAVEMTVRIASGNESRNAELSATPLIHYSDQQRSLTDSTLWVWRLDERPVLFSKVERLPSADGGTGGWQFCCVPVTVDKADVQWGRRFRWRSRESTTTWTDFSDIPHPAASATRRLLQMKHLARQFEGIIVNPQIDDREQMRLLPSSLLRYESAANDVVDGAVFGLTSKGTNPDALLMIEAAGVAAEDATWRFAAVGMSGDALTISLNDAEVWSKSSTAGPGDHRSWMWYVQSTE